MKVNEILNESTKVFEVKLDFNDLSTVQVAALKAIDDGRLDFDNASDRMLDVLYDLQDFNLLDQMFELTPTGGKAVRLTKKLGGSKEKRKAQSRKEINPDDLPDEDPYDTTDYHDATGYDEDEMSIYQPNRFGSPNQNN